jgi:hypothetical protein
MLKAATAEKILEGRARVSRRLWRRPIDPEKEAAIRADLVAAKAGIMKLAAALGVGVGTVQRIKAALASRRRADNLLLRPLRDSQAHPQPDTS